VSVVSGKNASRDKRDERASGILKEAPYVSISTSVEKASYFARTEKRASPRKSLKIERSSRLVGKFQNFANRSSNNSRIRRSVRESREGRSRDRPSRDRSWNPSGPRPISASHDQPSGKRSRVRLDYEIAPLPSLPRRADYRDCTDNSR